MKNNKGFTLVELLVSVGIMSIIMTLVTTMMINASRFFEKQSAMIELNNEAQIINNYLSEAFMEATNMEFVLEDDTTNMGRYELYRKDEVSGDPTAKGTQRFLYFYKDTAELDPEKGHALYVVSFKDTDTPPANPTGVEDDDIYLLSKHMTEFSVVIPTRTPDPDPVDPSAPTPDPTAPTTPVVETVKNPVMVQITYKLETGKAKAEFELTVDCRNRLDKVKISKADGSVLEYEAKNR